MESLLTQTISSLRKERNTFEKLNLQRKIGDGILTKRSKANKLKKSRSGTTNETPSLSRIYASSANFRTRRTYQHGATFIKCYSLILKRLKHEEWKFAALALDRLCLILFTFLIASFVISMIFSTPHFDA
ncbi:hypothetical protein OSTOST_07915 [Ostertagia ostertagi]